MRGCVHVRARRVRYFRHFQFGSVPLSQFYTDIQSNILVLALLSLRKLLWIFTFFIDGVVRAYFGTQSTNFSTRIEAFSSFVLVCCFISILATLIFFGILFFRKRMIFDWFLFCCCCSLAFFSGFDVTEKLLMIRVECLTR